jgi:hypothetical protein
VKLQYEVLLSFINEVLSYVKLNVDVGTWPSEPLEGISGGHDPLLGHQVSGSLRNEKHQDEKRNWQNLKQKFNHKIELITT